MPIPAESTPERVAHTADSRNTVPTPVEITPALLKQHSITPDEYARD